MQHVTGEEVGRNTSKYFLICYISVLKRKKNTEVSMYHMCWDFTVLTQKSIRISSQRFVFHYRFPSSDLMLVDCMMYRFHQVINLAVWYRDIHWRVGKFSTYGLRYRTLVPLISHLLKYPKRICRCIVWNSFIPNPRYWMDTKSYLVKPHLLPSYRTG